jgi:hypothetical protein
MKKITVLLSLILLMVVTAYAQGSFRATLKPGSSGNSVMIALLPNSSFTGKFTNVQFTLQVPNTVAAQPVVTIKSNPLNTYIPTANYLTQVVNEGGFYTYLFAASIAGSPDFNFTAAEINALEIVFNGSIGPATGRLAHLPDGGSTGQLAFYVEIGGNDLTDYAQMFYGTGAINGGNASSYSFVPYSNLLLPVTWIKFDVTKRDNDAVLNWIASDEQRNRFYDVERSFDGKNFLKIGTVQSKQNTTTTNEYSYVDENIGGQKKPIVYYRLKQIDVDGKFSFSKVYSLRYTEKSSLLSLYPNPARHQTLLNIDLNSDEKILISIVDAAGKLVFSESRVFGKGLTQHRLNLSTYAMGTYEVRLNSASINKSFKLLIQ